MTEGQPQRSPMPGKPRSDTGGVVSKFLGPSAARNGPFGVLGLRPTSTDEDAVLAALRSRLNQTAAHPEGFTPEADEARLAIHAAAAQLLDPATRRAMIEQWGGGQAPEPIEGVPQTSRGTDTQTRSESAADRTTPSSVARRDPVLDVPPNTVNDGAERDAQWLQQQAIIAIAANGGWNDRARSHLQMLAASRAIPASTVAIALARVDRSPRMSAPGVAVIEARSSAGDVGPSIGIEPEVQRRVSPILVWSVVGACVGIVAILIGVAIASATARRTPPAPNPVAVQEPATPRDTSGQAFPWKPESPRPAPSVAASATTDAQRWVQGIVGELDRANNNEDGALLALIRRIEEGGTRWQDLSGPDLLVAQRVIVDAFYLAETDESVSALIRAIMGASSPGLGAIKGQDVLRLVWAAGIVNRVLRESDLPVVTLDALQRSLRETLGTDRPSGDAPFEAGALAALRSLVDACARSGDADAWNGWISAASAIGTLVPTRRTEILLTALSRACEGMSGEASKGPNASAVSRIVPMISWHREPSAQRWLIAEFDAFDTRPEALAALTREISTRSSVPGVDATMVLPLPFSEADRGLLRDRFARLFGLSDEAERQVVDAAWAAAMDLVRERDQTRLSATESLDVAVSWSRLSEAAWLHWRGATGRAASVIQGVGAGSVAAPPGDRRGDTLRRDEAPDWTLRYIDAGADINRRVGLLLAFPSGDPHPADAETALGEALRGTPVQVREAARNVVRNHAASPVMVNALLEALPTAPRSVNTAEVVAMLSGLDRLPLDASDWRAVARRAVVERLLGTLAARSELAALDAMAERLAESHAVRAASPTETEGSEASQTPGLIESLTRQRNAWRDACEDLARPRNYPETIAAVERGLSASLRVAEGPIQRAVAHTHAVTRLMAMAIASERPGEIERVNGIVSRVKTEISVASNAIDQLRACERAMAELWEVRLGGRRLE